MGDYGFKMTIPGKEITSKDPRDYIVWSKYPPFKITKYGTGMIDFPGGTGTTTVTIKHGLNYKPAYLAYFENDNNGRLWINGVCLGAGNSTLTDGGRGFVSSVDNENIKFSYSGSQGGTSARKIPFRYILSDRPAFDVASGNDKPVGYQTVNNGMKVSKGIDVTKTKLYEQVINSNTDYLKYHFTKQNKITFSTAGAGESTVDYVHGLGYVPLFLAYGFFDNDIKEQLLPIGIVPQPIASGIFADTNKLTIDIIWAASGIPSTINFNYRIVVFKNNMLSTL